MTPCRRPRESSVATAPAGQLAADSCVEASKAGRSKLQPINTAVRGRRGPLSALIGAPFCPASVLGFPPMEFPQLFLSPPTKMLPFSKFSLFLLPPPPLPTHTPLVSLPHEGDASPCSTSQLFPSDSDVAPGGILHSLARAARFSAGAPVCADGSRLLPERKAVSRRSEERLRCQRRSL